MHQGDIGAPIRLLLVDGPNAYLLTDVHHVELWIRTPSLKVLQRLFDIVDPILGSVYYETVQGDLLEFGTYRFQARAVYADGRVVAFDTIDEKVPQNVFPPRTIVNPAPAHLRLGAPVPHVP